jgi:hypothetical protein
MTHFFLIAASSLLSLTATPVAARDAKPVATESQPAGSAQRTADGKSATKYCVVDQLTGSRIGHKTCKTRQQWIADEGYDPLAK